MHKNQFVNEEGMEKEGKRKRKNKFVISFQLTSTIIRFSNGVQQGKGTKSTVARLENYACSEESSEYLLIARDVS